MDLQTIGDKAVTSENACPPNNFRAYSPQIPDHSRPQPTTTGHRLRLEESWRTRVAMRGARLSMRYQHATADRVAAIAKRLSEILKS